MKEHLRLLYEMTVSNLPVKDAQDLDLILSALQREKNLLEWELDKSRKQLEKLEEKIKLTSETFYQKYQTGEMGDDEEMMT